MSVIDLSAREAESVRETPYGSVGIVHQGRDLKAWWIWKDAEDVDPVLEGREPVVLAAGDAFVIPPGTHYRGYRWPRDGGPCQFLAVSAADATFVES
jgi:hypothetical protein